MYQINFSCGKNVGDRSKIEMVPYTFRSTYSDHAQYVTQQLLNIAELVCNIDYRLLKLRK